MDLILEGFAKALSLLLSLDPEVLNISWLTLKISASATLISLALGVAGGAALALSHFPGRKILLSLVNTGMGVPPVVVGLFISLMLWRSGPLGTFGLIYTPWAMLAAQVVIATPIVMGISAAALQNLPPKLKLQLMALGATRLQTVFLMIREARLPILSAGMAGFGGVISEVGASMMVGGNIKGYTRVLTTATVSETSKGNFDLALALGILLLLLSFGVNAAMTYIQQRDAS